MRSNQFTRRCRVEVCDHGPGIPEAPGRDRRARDHAGLGLAIARTILEGYGGTISAGNGPEGGACFLVQLPLARAGVAHRPMSQAV